MADTGYPHVLRRVAKGVYQAVFKGGVELPVEPDNDNPEPTNAVQWVDENGALVARIFAYPRAYDDASFMKLEADDAFVNLRGTGADAALAEVFAGSFKALLIDGNGNSDFASAAVAVSNANYGTLKVDVGTASMTFDGSSTVANATVLHDLGRVPKFAACVGLNGTGAALFYSVVPLGYDVAYTDTNQVTFEAQQVDLGAPLPGGWAFAWIAIG